MTKALAGWTFGFVIGMFAEILRQVGLIPDLFPVLIYGISIVLLLLSAWFDDNARRPQARPKIDRPQSTKA